MRSFINLSLFLLLGFSLLEASSFRAKELKGPIGLEALSGTANFQGTVKKDGEGNKELDKLGALNLSDSGLILSNRSNKIEIFNIGLILLNKFNKNRPRSPPKFS